MLFLHSADTILVFRGFYFSILTSFVGNKVGVHNNTVPKVGVHNNTVPKVGVDNNTVPKVVYIITSCS